MFKRLVCKWLNVDTGEVIIGHQKLREGVRYRVLAKILHPREEESRAEHLLWVEEVEGDGRKYAFMSSDLFPKEGGLFIKVNGQITEIVQNTLGKKKTPKKMPKPSEQKKSFLEQKKTVQRLRQNKEQK